MLSTPALLFDIHHDSAGKDAGQVLSWDIRSLVQGHMALGWAPRALTPELASRVSDPGWSGVRAHPQKSLRPGQSPRRPAKPTRFQRPGSMYESGWAQDH